MIINLLKTKIHRATVKEARIIQNGDKIIIMAGLDLKEALALKPKIVDESNKMSEISHHEKHGELF